MSPGKCFKFIQDVDTQSLNNKSKRRQSYHKVFSSSYILCNKNLGNLKMWSLPDIIFFNPNNSFFIVKKSRRFLFVVLFLYVWVWHDMIVSRLNQWKKWIEWKTEQKYKLFYLNDIVHQTMWEMWLVWTFLW